MTEKPDNKGQPKDILPTRKVVSPLDMAEKPDNKVPPKEILPTRKIVSPLDMMEKPDNKGQKGLDKQKGIPTDYDKSSKR